MHDQPSHATLTATLAFVSGLTGLVLTEHVVTALLAVAGSLVASTIAQLGRRAIHVLGDVMEQRARRRLVRMGLLKEPAAPPSDPPPAP